MKKIIIALCVAVGLFAIGYNAYQSEKQATTGKRKVYAVLPLSGLYAQYGKDAKSVIDWYMRTQNPDFEIVEVDSAGEPAKALTAMQQKLIYADKPIVLSMFAPISSVLLPILKEKNGFLFSVSTVGITSDLDNYQIISRSAEDVVSTLMPYVQAHFQNVSVFYSQDEYGLRELRVFEKMFKGDWKKEAFVPQNADVRIEVLKQIKNQPEAIIVLGSPSPAYINIFKELKNHEYQGAIISDSGFIHPHIKNAIDKAGEGVISVSINVVTDDTSEKIKQLKEYIKKANTGLYDIPVEALETLKIIDYTIENNLPFEQQTYTSIGNWKGLSGDILLQDGGKSSFLSYILTQVKDGQIVPLKE